MDFIADGAANERMMRILRAFDGLRPRVAGAGGPYQFKFRRVIRLRSA